MFPFYSLCWDRLASLTLSVILSYGMESRFAGYGRMLISGNNTTGRIFFHGLFDMVITQNILQILLNTPLSNHSVRCALGIYLTRKPIKTADNKSRSGLYFFCFFPSFTKQNTSIN